MKEVTNCRPATMNEEQTLYLTICVPKQLLVEFKKAALLEVQSLSEWGLRAMTIRLRGEKR